MNQTIIKNFYKGMRLFKLYIEGKTAKQTLFERDPLKAFEYTKRACEMNDLFGCLNASLMCRKGKRLEKHSLLE